MPPLPTGCYVQATSLFFSAQKRLFYALRCATSLGSLWQGAARSKEVFYVAKRRFLPQNVFQRVPLTCTWLGLSGWCVLASCWISPNCGARVCGLPKSHQPCPASRVQPAAPRPADHIPTWFWPAKFRIKKQVFLFFSGDLLASWTRVESEFLSPCFCKEGKNSGLIILFLRELNASWKRVESEFLSACFWLFVSNYQFFKKTR